MSDENGVIEFSVTLPDNPDHLDADGQGGHARHASAGGQRHRGDQREFADCAQRCRELLHRGRPRHHRRHVALNGSKGRSKVVRLPWRLAGGIEGGARGEESFDETILARLRSSVPHAVDSTASDVVVTMTAVATSGRHPHGIPGRALPDAGTVAPAASCRRAA